MEALARLVTDTAQRGSGESDGGAMIKRGTCDCAHEWTKVGFSGVDLHDYRCTRCGLHFRRSSYRLEQDGDLFTCGFKEPLLPCSWHDCMSDDRSLMKKVGDRMRAGNWRLLWGDAGD